MADAADAGVEISDNPAEERFEARIGGTLAGLAQYLRSADVIAFTHTEVDLAHEGRGVGSALARGALDAAREAGLKVVPVCPFFAGYIRKHPEYQPLVHEKGDGAP
ncbi:GNAT family N-acetyltransferase [Streptomyces boncukensis]|uniref:N-acetyltransferase n=1 Tax=Streptomyces boncukensis TaxID=2711219 RepID=A0A6G4WRK0_9ACTN|nr:GNAT family N-acetyltransferase [Streptomyces boncukensis]NGO67260.1 N-acetyltransferase [Streptomyces boncukensis]